MTYQDILFEQDGETAWITINREKTGNAFRMETVREMIDAFERTRRDAECRVVVLTGTGHRFFCIGGDHESSHASGDDRVHYGTMFPVADLYDLIDKHPKPVIAMVNGYAVGGGNVLALMCDLTIAARHAVFRQVGPMMGSFDAGFGTWYLEEAIGRKRAKEMWYLGRKYTAEDACARGLVNEVVEGEHLRSHVAEICSELADRGAFAIAALKAAFHARHAGASGLSRITVDMLVNQYYRTEESKELGSAFSEKRRPDKSKFNR